MKVVLIFVEAEVIRNVIAEDLIKNGKEVKIYHVAFFP